MLFYFWLSGTELRALDFHPTHRCCPNLRLYHDRNSDNGGNVKYLPFSNKEEIPPCKSKDSSRVEMIVFDRPVKALLITTFILK